MQNILAAVAAALHNAVVVLQAPPGAGKSTVLPLYLLQQQPELGTKHPQQIILVQPRRVAALNIAHYLAEQLGEQVGEQVGYWVRQERKASAKTRLLVVTDGLFTRMIQADPELTTVATVIFDEFHERNLHADLGLALTLETKELRADLQVLIMSATLPAETLCTWLEQSGQPTQSFTSEGRQFPIQTQYRPTARLQDWQQALLPAVREGLQLAEHGVLVFLPGQREIRRLAGELANEPGVVVMPLYGGLPLREQRRVLQPLAPEQQQQGLRKVVLATNIAETSVTIPDIDVVVDSGRERQARYYPRYAMTQLSTRLISQAAAAQRAGRAGRVRAGHCLRLWSESLQQGLAPYSSPAIETEDLSSLVLEIAAWGSRPEHLLWFTPPAPSALRAAEQKLQVAELLDDNLHLTALGKQVQSWGTDLVAATLLALAHERGQQQNDNAQAAALLAAFVEESTLEQEPDLFIRLQGLLAGGKQAHNPADQRMLARYQYWCRKLAIKPQTQLADKSVYVELLLAALPLRLARRQRAQPQSPAQSTGAPRFLLASGNAAVFPNLQTAAEWLLVSSLSLQEDAREATIWQALALDDDFMGDWLQRHAKQRLGWQWQGKQGKLLEVEERYVGQLLISSRETGRAPDAGLRTRALLEVIRERDTELFNSPATQQWLARVRVVADLLGCSASEASTESSAQPWLTENLLLDLERWAKPYVTLLDSRAQALAWDPLPALQAQLTYTQQQQLDTLLPVRWQAPSGRSHAVSYDHQGQAVIALKLQEVFGTPQSPEFAQGRVRPTFELLSPAGRPLHRTNDLASFWQDAYVHVRKEMRGRYPKHPWPEEPWAATATHLTKRALNRSEEQNSQGKHS